jgi:hypothetical protein
VQPHSITLFATTGDPEGIRHLDTSIWSGDGLAFNKEWGLAARRWQERR